VVKDETCGIPRSAAAARRRSAVRSRTPRDGVITTLDVEKEFVDHDVSSAQAVLARL
jgi:peroxiredoxin